MLKRFVTVNENISSGEMLFLPRCTRNVTFAAITCIYSERTLRRSHITVIFKLYFQNVWFPIQLQNICWQPLLKTRASRDVCKFVQRSFLTKNKLPHASFACMYVGNFSIQMCIFLKRNNHSHSLHRAIFIGFFV